MSKRLHSKWLPYMFQLHKPDRKLLLPCALAFLTFVIGDIVSTYLALEYGTNLMEGVAATSNMIQNGLSGYIAWLVPKMGFFILFVALALMCYIVGMASTAKFTLYGIALAGLYLTLSNITALIFGFPLMPPGNPLFWVGIIWPFCIFLLMAVGLFLDYPKLVKMMAELQKQPSK